MTGKIRKTFGISLDQELQIITVLIAVVAGYFVVSAAASAVPDSLFPLLILWIFLSLYLTWRIAKRWMGW